MRRSTRILFSVFAILLLGIASGGLFYWFAPAPEVKGDYNPNILQKIAYNAPLQIEFSKRMNQAATERAFQLAPAVKGKLTWENEYTLIFTPEQKFTIGQKLHLTIAKSAQDYLGKNLADDFELDFLVIGAPQVLFVSPANAAELAQIQGKEGADKLDQTPVILPYTPAPQTSDTEISGSNQPNSEMESASLESQNQTVANFKLDRNTPKITVMFDRPLREMTTLDESEQTQKIDFLKIEPPVDGKFRWLNSSSFQFIPANLPMATKFTVTINKGVKTLDGGQTEKEYSWHFETDEPRLISSEPADGEDYFDPKNPIKLHFNQKVDLESVFKNLTLEPSAEGFLNRQLAHNPKDPTTILITSKPALKNPENFTITLKKGLRGFQDVAKKGLNYTTKESTQEFKIQFKTYGRAKILEYSPKNNAANVGLHNVVTIKFATPMDLESLRERLKFTPEIKDFEMYLYDRDTVAEISTEFLPAKTYTLELQKGAKDQFKQTLEDELKLTFTTSDASPYFSLMARGEKGFFSESLPPEYYLRSVNLKTVKAEFCKLDQTAFLAKEKEWSWYDYNCQEPQKWDITIDSPRNEARITALPLQDKLTGQGIYFLKLYSPEYLQDWDQHPYAYRQLFFMADTALSLKNSNNEVLIWATDLVTGAPVEKMYLEVFEAQSNTVVAKGYTDGNGLLKIQNIIGGESGSLYVFGQKEQHWGIVGSSWNDGIATWDFGIPGDWRASPSYYAYLYTDRPIYRPDQEVFFKGIVRAERDAKFTLPQKEKFKEVSVKIEDAIGNAIFNQKMPLNANGTFNGKIKLAPEAPVGAYYLSINEPERDFYGSRVFYVEEYRKPEFKVEIHSAKKEFVNKEHLQAEIQANYYFGGALPASTKVAWKISSADYYFDQYEGEWYNFSAKEEVWGCWENCPMDENEVVSGEGVLDEQGRLKIDMPLDISKKEISQLYTLTATVANLNQQEISKNETFIIHQADFYVGIKSRNYVGKVNEKNTFDVIAVDPAGKPLPNQKIKVAFSRREWKSVQKEGVDGNFYWESASIDTPVSTDEVMTDLSGKASVNFLPAQGGEYTALAQITDTHNNVAAARGFIWITSADYIGWGVNNHDRIDLILDKQNYKIGETAKILVKSPFQKPVKALLTVERQKIMESRMIDLKSNSEILELPVTAEMLPNVYVSVLLFKGMGNEVKVINLQNELNALKATLTEKQNALVGLKSELTSLEQDLQEIEKIAVENSANLEDYHNSARYQIKFQKQEDLTAQIAQLETEIAILTQTQELKTETLTTVKKSLDLDTLAALEAKADTVQIRPEFKLGYATIFVDTESKRLKLEIMTDKKRYHAGDQVNLKIKTADAQGSGVPAEVSLAVVDESILALKSRNLEDLVKFFYEKRGLKINNAQSLVYFVDRLNVKAQQGAKGGGGADESALEKKKRGDFKDTALWEPELQTDTEGNATITFTLPDNLTTWQILAIGATTETLVGSAEKDFITSQDLIVSPVLPRFLKMNDTIKIGAVVHNFTGEKQKVTVSLQGENLVNQESTEKTVEVANDGEGKVMWEVKANVLPTQEVLSKINFKAESALYSDAVEMQLPLQTFSIPEIVATSGITTDVAREKIFFPQTISKETGEIKLSVGATLASNFNEGLKYLAEFPYGCAEQTMSRHLPNVILKQYDQLFGAKGLPKIVADEKELDKMAQEGIQKLYQFQRSDGGWGYWTDSDKSYPYLSAYVLFGLHETQKAGYKIDANVLKKGTAYLKDFLARHPQPANDPWYYLSQDDQVFALWALGQMQAGDLALNQKLFDERKTLALYSKGYLWMNLMDLEKAEKTPEVQAALKEKISQLKSEIENQALLDQRIVHFEEKTQNYFSMNSNVRTNAILLKALVQSDIKDPLIPKLVAWLQSQRRDGHWENTQETVWTLLAFNDFFLASKELEANYNFKAQINGEESLKGAFAAKNLFSREEIVTAIKDLRIGQPSNEILLQKEGEGNLYYDLTAKYYLPLEEVKERSEGISVIRAYYQLADKKEAQPLREAKVGEILKGKLTLLVPSDRQFVLAEEFLPAGFEPINFNLETEDQTLQAQINQCRDQKTYYWCDNDLWRFYHREYRDDRIALFADNLPAGVYEFEFLVRVTSSGSFRHLPAQASQMYFPEIFGRTSGEIFTVKE